MDFRSVPDAKRAMEALRHSTHLYGRRLVLEWAEQEDTIESLQRKTATHFAGGGAGASAAAKRVKRAKIMEDVLLRGSSDK